MSAAAPAAGAPANGNGNGVEKRKHGTVAWLIAAAAAGALVWWGVREYRKKKQVDPIDGTWILPESAPLPPLRMVLSKGVVTLPNSPSTTMTYAQTSPGNYKFTVMVSPAASGGPTVPITTTGTLSNNNNTLSLATLSGSTQVYTRQ